MFWFGFLIGYVVAHPALIITITQLAKYFRRRDIRRNNQSTTSQVKPTGDKRKDKHNGN